MNNYKKILSAIAIVLLSSVSAFAQKEQSPYSKFGYGMLGEYATSMQRNMGGVGIAMTSSRQINMMNPASYAQADSLSLIWDIGLDMTRLWSKENNETGKSFGGGLDYMTLQFPICKIVGASVGLVPYSSVGYSFGGEVKDEKDRLLGRSTFSGIGGLNELYFGVGVEPIKGLSIGANFSYLFGTIINDSYVIQDGGAANTLFEQSMEIRDWNVLVGLQYTLNIKELHKITLGATYSPKKDFRGKTWGVYYDVNSDQKPDTVGHSKMNGQYSKPNAFGVGLSYTYNDKITVEGDFTYQDWGKAKYEGLKDDKGNVIQDKTEFDNRWKAALGFQYTPKERGNYFQRMSYRCGANYTHDYIMVRGNNTKVYGAAIGFGFPTMGSKTIFNLGFEYKHRVASPASNLVSENYFNITVGVNFNEFAFWRNKIR